MSHKKDQLSVGDLHKQNICMSHKKDQLSVGDLHKQNICMSHKKDQLSVGDLHKQNIPKRSVMLVISQKNICMSQKIPVICW